MKYKSLIESFYPSFSKQEKKIADYILNDKEDTISFMPINEISKKILVSEATIVRFVKKLGFKGFIQFKLEIAKESVKKEKNSSKKNYIENISENIFKTITETKSLVDKKQIDKAVDIINKAENMYIYGLGSSGEAALEMQNRFLRFGRHSHNVNDSHYQVMYSATVTEKDVIVAISLSGETIDLIYPLMEAKKRKCPIIAITNYIMSPVSKLSDITLLTAGRETPLDGGSLVAKISQLYVIDILATGYALKNKSTAQKTKHDIAVSIANKNKN